MIDGCAFRTTQDVHPSEGCAARQRGRRKKHCSQNPHARKPRNPPDPMKLITSSISPRGVLVPVSSLPPPPFRRLPLHTHRRPLTGPLPFGHCRGNRPTRLQKMEICPLSVHRAEVSRPPIKVPSGPQSGRGTNKPRSTNGDIAAFFSHKVYHAREGCGNMVQKGSLCLSQVL